MPSKSSLESIKRPNSPNETTLHGNANSGREQLSLNNPSNLLRRITLDEPIENAEWELKYIEKSLRDVDLSLSQPLDEGKVSALQKRRSDLLKRQGKKRSELRGLRWENAKLALLALLILITASILWDAMKSLF